MRLSIKCVFLILVFTAGISAANAGKWGIGVNLGKSNSSGYDTKNRCFSCQTEDSNSTQGVYLTYKYSDAYGLELGHAKYGDYFADGVTADYVSVLDSSGRIRVVAVPTRFSVRSLDVKTTYVAATARYQFSKKLTATGRLGIASVKQQKTVSFIDFNKVDFISESSNTAIFSASLDYSISDSLKVGLRFDGVDIFYGFGVNLHASF